MVYIIAITVALVLLITYIVLRKAIYKDSITRIEHGNHVDIYVNDTLFDSFDCSIL